MRLTIIRLALPMTMTVTVLAGYPLAAEDQPSLAVAEWYGESFRVFSETDDSFSRSGEISLEDAVALPQEIYGRKSGLVELRDADGNSIWINETSVRTTARPPEAVLPSCREMAVATGTSTAMVTRNLGDGRACREE